MGRTTWPPHPGKNATKQEWLQAIEKLSREARIYRLTTWLVAISSVLAAVVFAWSFSL